MPNLSQLFPVENIVLEMDAADKAHLFQKAALFFENQYKIDHTMVIERLNSRESLGSTGLGSGVAIPHGRIKGLKQPLAALIRLANPIDFDAPDHQPVSLLFFLLVPEHATQQHLQILSEIAELLCESSVRNILLSTNQPLEIHQLLSTEIFPT